MTKRPFIEAVLLETSQLGWRCQMAFYVTTRRQCTDELVTVTNGGKGRLLALWATYRAALRERKRLQQLPGEFNLDVVVG